MNDQAMNGYDQKMLEATLESFNQIYQIYQKNSQLLCSIDIKRQLNDMKALANDISAVKSITAKHALVDVLLKSIDAVYASSQKITDIINDFTGKMMSVKNIMPMPKAEVNKILKAFNFHELPEPNDVPKPGVYSVPVRHFPAQKFTPVTKQDIESGAVSLCQDVSSTCDPKYDKLLEDVAGLDIKDESVPEKDVKPVTIEQFENVVDDVKNAVKEATAKPAPKKRGRKPKAK